MRIFELEKPGSWLVSLDPDLSWRLSSLIIDLESTFFEANLALNLFEYEREREAQPVRSQEAWLRARDRRSEIAELLRRSSDGTQDYAELYFRADLIARREAWEQGEEPRQLSHKRPFLYARSFLFSIDMFGRFLCALASEAAPLVSLKDLSDDFEGAFPDLRGVRNTAAHLDDRSRGLGGGRNPKPMQLAPVENGAISAPGGALVLGCLNGSRYGSTMASGVYGEIDVSPASMQVSQGLLQAAYSRFTWSGPKEFLPR